MIELIIAIVGLVVVVYALIALRAFASYLGSSEFKKLKAKIKKDPIIVVPMVFEGLLKAVKFVLLFIWKFVIPLILAFIAGMLFGAYIDRKD